MNWNNKKEKAINDGETYLERLSCPLLTCLERLPCPLLTCLERLSCPLLSNSKMRTCRTSKAEAIAEEGER